MNAIDINNLLDRDKIKEEITSILQNFEKKKKEINIKRGIYLYGNPGSGKSYLINYPKIWLVKIGTARKQQLTPCLRLATL